MLYLIVLEFSENYINEDFKVVVECYFECLFLFYVYILFCYKFCYFCVCNKVIICYCYKVDFYLDYFEKEIKICVLFFKNCKVI